MTAARVPFFSTPVVATRAPAATHAFGYAWHDVVTRVEGFSIDATEEKLLSVRNITHAEPRESLSSYIQSNADHYFILHPGEYVTRVDVWSTDEVVTALRLHTTKRVTLWYGDTDGGHVTFEADEGFCINALCGKCESEHGCSELGVVYAPIEIAHEGHTIVAPRVVAVPVAVDPDVDLDHPDQFTFGLAPRAVVIRTTESAVAGVRGVTEAEYDRIVRSPQSFEHDGDETWLVLVDGERIKAVGVQIEDKQIKSIQFRSNLQTSTVFGFKCDAPMQWLTSEEQTESYVCGVSTVESDDDGWIEGLAILCTTPTCDTAESADPPHAIKRQRR